MSGRRAAVALSLPPPWFQPGRDMALDALLLPRDNHGECSLLGR